MKVDIIYRFKVNQVDFILLHAHDIEAAALFKNKLCYISLKDLQDTILPNYIINYTNLDNIKELNEVTDKISDCKELTITDINDYFSVHSKNVIIQTKDSSCPLKTTIFENETERLLNELAFVNLDNLYLITDKSIVSDSNKEHSLFCISHFYGTTNSNLFAITIEDLALLLDANLFSILAPKNESDQLMLLSDFLKSDYQGINLIPGQKILETVTRYGLKGHTLVTSKINSSTLNSSGVEHSHF